jgi:CubicO group peptidase (beta-lactamase class C family)
MNNSLEQDHRTGRRFPDTPFATQINGVFDAFAERVEAYGVCGAQLAVHHGGTTVSAEVGELEHRGGRPVTRDAAFPVGSITKTFTATLAMTLVADGDLGLDEPLGEHLPELADLSELSGLSDDLGDLLTLRHLLSHTGGLACGPDSAELSASSLRRYVADHFRPPNLMLPPGAGFSYSNMGYILTGRLVEAITGMSWSEAMASIVLAPLGIEPAFIAGGSTARPTAVGHSVNPALGRARPVRQSLALAEAPAGALCVSALDLVALGRVHVAPGVPGLLPPAQAELMRQAMPGAAPFGLADGWGLGLAVFEGAGNTWAGHDGNADGTACYLRIEPADGWIIALTTNANTGVGLWRDLLARLAEAGVPAPTAAPMLGDHAKRPSMTPPPECAGVYANGDTEYVVTREDGGFCLTVDGEQLAMSAGEDGLTFALLDRTSGQRLPGGRFQRDPVTGEINGIQITGRLARRHSRVGAGVG